MHMFPARITLLHILFSLRSDWFISLSDQLRCVFQRLVIGQEHLTLVETETNLAVTNYLQMSSTSGWTKTLWSKVSCPRKRVQNDCLEPANLEHKIRCVNNCTTAYSASTKCRSNVGYFEQLTRSYFWSRILKSIFVHCHLPQL